MRRSLVLLLLVCFLSPILSAQEDTKAAESNTKASGRIEASGTVLDEIQAAPDKGIPEEVLGSAECVAVVPSLLKGGFIVAANYGRGVASCRTPKGWSAPDLRSRMDRESVSYGAIPKNPANPIQARNWQLHR